MLVEGIVESEEVTDGVDEEKSVLFNEISLVVPIFNFFLFPASIGSCDVATRVGGSISSGWDVLMSVWMPIVAVEAEEASETKVDDNERSWLTWWLS